MKTQLSFNQFFQERIEYLKEAGRLGTARNYKRAKESLEKYLCGKQLQFSEITRRFVDDYSDWLMKRGMLRNSASFHMRILRSVFNKGVMKGLAEQSYPFSCTYTGIDNTNKRCVSKLIVKKLVRLDLSQKSELSFARALFLFSLYSRGMSFIDIAFLRKENICGSEIIYKRRKTGKILRVRIEKEIKGILKEYGNRDKTSPYVFNLVGEGSREDRFKKYENELSAYNYRLAQISEIMGLSTRLTSYTARHTWASLAYQWNIPVSVISEGMGHTSEKTTKIYLASLDNRAIDKANRRFLDFLGK